MWCSPYYIFKLILLKDTTQIATLHQVSSFLGNWFPIVWCQTCWYEVLWLFMLAFCKLVPSQEYHDSETIFTFIQIFVRQKYQDSLLNNYSHTFTPIHSKQGRSWQYTLCMMLFFTKKKMYCTQAIAFCSPWNHWNCNCPWWLDQLSSIADIPVKLWYIWSKVSLFLQALNANLQILGIVCELRGWKVCESLLMTCNESIITPKINLTTSIELEWSEGGVDIWSIKISVSV